MDYRLIGFGWMLWDFNWFRARSADSSFRRIAPRVSDGDIIVMHDGDESAPTRDQRHTVDAPRADSAAPCAGIFVRHRVLMIHRHQQG